MPHPDGAHRYGTLVSLLINALTGEIVAKRNYGSNIEATPAVYGNRLVVGLRSEYILGISFE